METLAAVLPALSLVATIVSGVVAWGFATGRWTQRQEHAAEAVAELKKALEDAVCDFETRMKEEHADKKELREKVNIEVGRFSERIGGLEQSLAFRADIAQKDHAIFFTRLDKLEEISRDLQRQIDRGSGAGV